MSPLLAERHLQIRDAVRRFADERIRPVANELDDSERFPAELYAEMAGLGLFGIAIPEALGGAGGDALAYAVAMEELARGYASVADQCGLVELVGTLLAAYGTPEQQERYLRPLLKAERRCAYALTEAEAGSDLSNLRSTATRTADGWTLAGSKLWIHNAPVCDFACVLARTEPHPKVNPPALRATPLDRGAETPRPAAAPLDRGARHRGMSIFLVDRDAPGFEVGRKEHKMGQRASPVGALDFREVKLPPDALLGPEGRGFQLMMSVLDKGRIGIGALAVGIVQAALEASIDYARVRRQFEKPIAEFQAVQWMIADMAKDAHAARLMVHAAAVKLDGGERATIEASMAKCFASDAAVAHTANAVQIHGGSGYIRGFEVERLYRDAKITQIYEGTNQIQRMIIARQLLG